MSLSANGGLGATFQGGGALSSRQYIQQFQTYQQQVDSADTLRYQQQVYGQGIPPLTYGFIPSPAPPMKITEKSWLVYHRNGNVLGSYESELEAVRAARLQCVKDTEEYLVFKAVKRIAPKPVELDEADL